MKIKIPELVTSTLLIMNLSSIILFRVGSHSIYAPHYILAVFIYTSVFFILLQTIHTSVIWYAISDSCFSFSFFVPGALNRVVFQGWCLCLKIVTGGGPNQPWKSLFNAINWPINFRACLKGLCHFHYGDRFTTVTQPFLRKLWASLHASYFFPKITYPLNFVVCLMREGKFLGFISCALFGIFIAETTRK